MVRDVMARVTGDMGTVRPDNTVAEAAEKMRTQDTKALLVYDAGSFVGVLTNRDIATRVVAAGLDPLTTRVADVMTRNVMFCYEDQDLDEVAVLARSIPRGGDLLILDRKSRLVGIVEGERDVPIQGYFWNVPSEGPMKSTLRSLLYGPSPTLNLSSLDAPIGVLGAARTEESIPRTESPPNSALDELREAFSKKFDVVQSTDPNWNEKWEPLARVVRKERAEKARRRSGFFKRTG